MSWLGPLRRSLDGAGQPRRFFLRDDDAGWNDERLFELLDTVAARGLAVDLAVIPAAANPRLASSLIARSENADRPLGVHQHGLGHVNHERSGRRCEFGSSRDRDAQRRDIATGRRRLFELFGEAVDPIFTPPWNRCSRDTGVCLVELGFAALSRESRARPIDVPGLAELPVSVDWFARRKGVRLSASELGGLLAGATAGPGPVGVMFHHAVMDANERAAAGELLDLLASHPNAAVHPMRDLLRCAASGPSRRPALSA